MALSFSFSSSFFGCVFASIYRKLLMYPLILENSLKLTNVILGFPFVTFVRSIFVPKVKSRIDNPELNYMY